MSSSVSASDPGSELDALAYGAPSRQPRPSARASMRRPAIATLPEPVVIEASPVASRSSAFEENSPGLLAIVGLDNRQFAPAPPPSAVPLEAYARVAAPPPIIAVASPVEPVSPPIEAVSYGPEYRLGAGDKLRVVVFGQEGLTNTYSIDAGGAITMPLIGRVSARGHTPGALAQDITARLRKGFIREPSVAVEIESYRPFFILGEVAAPGQYPYVPNMSVEAAVAIAGGFSPRARRDSVTVTHPAQGGLLRAEVPLGTPLSPGDTVLVSERWF